MSFTLLIQPCGYVPLDILLRLSKDLENNINFSVTVSSETLVPPLIHYDWKRGQYFAEKILSWIYENLGGLGYDRIVGICNIDAYVSPLNFVFGLADPVRGVALVFLPRLKPSFYGEHENFERFYVRLFKEVLHELGHTFGLRHCNIRKCVMSFSNSILDVDFKEAAFCKKCAGKLLKAGIEVSRKLMLP